MLWRHFIHNRKHVFNAVHNGNITVIFNSWTSNAFTRQQFQLTFYLIGYSICQAFTSSNHNSARPRIMFRLGQEVCGEMNWISTVVSNNTDFARARNHVDIDLTKYLAFCSGYVNITRAYDFIDLWNAFSTICKSCYTLSATNLVYRINASKLSCT